MLKSFLVVELGSLLSLEWRSMNVSYPIERTLFQNCKNKTKRRFFFYLRGGCLLTTRLARVALHRTYDSTLVYRVMWRDWPIPGSGVKFRRTSTSSKDLRQVRTTGRGWLRPVQWNFVRGGRLRSSRDGSMRRSGFDDFSLQSRGGHYQLWRIQLSRKKTNAVFFVQGAWLWERLNS